MSDYPMSQKPTSQHYDVFLRFFGTRHNFTAARPKSIGEKRRDNLCPPDWTI